MNNKVHRYGPDIGDRSGPFVTGVQSSNIPIIFVDNENDDHKIVMANSSFLRMTGIEYSMILGKPVTDVFAQITDQQNIDYILGRLSGDQPGTWEITCRRNDGSTYAASLFIHPQRDQSAHRQHILSFYVLNDPQDRFKKSDEEARMLFRHAPGFIATSKGPEHLITFANDSYKKFVGYENLEGRTVAEAMPEIAEQGFIEILDRVLQTGIPFRGEAVPIDLRDVEKGKTIRRYANFVYEPVRNADLEIVGIFCEGYDVTDQIEAQEALKTLQTQFLHASRVNAMGTMATTMGHELNQPLSAITNYVTGCLRLMNSGEVASGDIRPALLSIQSSAHRASNIIRTLRDLTDRRVRPSAAFKLKPVVDESLSLIRSACSVDTQLIANIPADLSLGGDRVQIQQVIINLVRNGCDAVSQLAKQNVTISAETLSDEIVISVRDNGPGVSAETAQSLFTWSETIKEDGMGLGLSISRTIVESHGGRIWLEESNEAGSEFRFAVPIAQSRGAEPEQ